MKLLVTGASGFIGRNILLHAPRDWQIWAVYNSTVDLPQFVASRGLQNVTAVRCDLTVATAVDALATAVGGVDAVLHLAANGDPAFSALHPARDLEQSTLGLVRLLERIRAGHFVYVSSGAVYDGLNGPVSPATACTPRLPYAVSKLACEHYVRFFCERRGSIDSFINVRFFGAYGPYEAPRKITTRWLSAVIGGQREFVIRGNGENLIDFMYVDDAVDGFLALIRATGTRMTVDFASGAPVTVNQVVAAMADACGAAVTVRHDGHTEEFIEFRSVDRTMADRFGFSARTTLGEGLRRLRTHLETAGDAHT